MYLARIGKILLGNPLVIHEIRSFSSQAQGKKMASPFVSSLIRSFNHYLDEEGVISHVPKDLTYTGPVTKEEAILLSNKLMSIPWTDNQDRVETTAKKAEDSIDRYRTQASKEGQDKELYGLMEKVYNLKEIAKFSDKFAEEVALIMRLNMDETGPFGTETKASEELKERSQLALEEYLDFVDNVGKIENSAVVRKVELDLGRKMVILRQMLQIDDFSLKYKGMACDHILSEAKVKE